MLTMEEKKFYPDRGCQLINVEEMMKAENSTLGSLQSN
jgi:hypothetical protein